MKAALKNPIVRLALRAALAAGATFVTQLQASEALDKSVLVSAIVAAGWTFAEVFTPLNALVGYHKQEA